MTRRFMKLTWITACVGCLLPLLIWVYSFFKAGEAALGIDVAWGSLLSRPGLIPRLLGAALGAAEPGLWMALFFLVLLAAGVAAAPCVIPRRSLDLVEWWSSEQCRHLDRLPGRWVGASVFAGAAASLLLELAVIRWQGTVFALFAFYKNFGLLACFAGLGLGYAVSGRGQIPLVLAPLLLAWQMALLLFTRNGPAGWNIDILNSSPEMEQLSIALVRATSLPQYAAVALLLGAAFMLTALAFVPVGQLCGRLMDRLPKLRAYGLNLLGSLAGVLAMFGLSYLWTPPAVWFAVCLAVLLLFLAFDARALAWGALFTLGAVMALIWPVNFSWNATYSPYQLLEFGPDRNGALEVRAAGIYHQRILDLSPGRLARLNDARWSQIAAYYEMPYRIAGRAGEVAIVGSGTGNDVAAALRRGARRVDAVEIDPAILAYGMAYHPERPYQDPRVRAIVNDARTHLRNTDRSYDLIVYGLLDSHTLLSHGSSVRLDSFVYTVEAFREARRRLKEGGVLSLSFGVVSPALGRKLYLMLQEAFGGAPPVCISSKYDGSVTFLERKGGRLGSPAELLRDSGFEDASKTYADASLKADVSTDDWPFFYMPRRSYPVSYLAVLAMMLLLSAGLMGSLFEGRLRPSHPEFFLLGAGFLLVETKGITELGLAFGNTWHVIGIVIAGILLMAFLANLAVQRLRIERPAVPYVLLLAALLLGAGIALAGGFPSTAWGRAAGLAVLTGPLFFSGIAFSAALRSSEDVSGALAANLMGAMLGGLLEYNAMYFGFAFLYGLAFVLYGAAFWASGRRSA